MTNLLAQYKADPANVEIIAYERGSAEICWRGGRNALFALDFWPMLFGEQTPQVRGEYMFGDYRIKVVGWSASDRLVLAQRID